MAEEINVRSSFLAFLVALVWNTDSYYQTAVRRRATMVLTKAGDMGLEEEEAALVVAPNGAAVELEVNPMAMTAIRDVRDPLSF
jgi:hypothetical protein